MIEIFVLIGWIDAFKAGGVVNIEFTSESACLEAKELFEQRHSMKSIEDRDVFNDDDWVECVKK